MDSWGSIVFTNYWTILLDPLTHCKKTQHNYKSNLEIANWTRNLAQQYWGMSVDVGRCRWPRRVFFFRTSPITRGLSGALSGPRVAACGIQRYQYVQETCPVNHILNGLFKENIVW